MSRERELLERAYYVLGELSYAILKDSGEYNLAGDIYEFLSTPEPEQDEEPVAWMYPDDLERFETNETFAQAYSIKCGSPSQGTTEPLYRHPAQRPEFVRLSEEEVTEVLTSAYDMYAAICAVENRLVEKNK